MLSKVEYFQETQGKGLKILTPKQTVQGLPVVLAQVKPGNTPENLLNKIRQIISRKRNH